VYGGGSSEEYLGELGWQKRGIVMDTKLYPNSTFGGSGITHSASDVRKFLLESLKALKAEKIHLFYLHAPDRNVPFEETFKALNDLHKEGYFEKLGVSNFMSWEVAQVQEICIKNEWIRPTVYQGVYNALHRGVEPELFPCLRKYNMGFFAFSPSAGGFLTSKFQRQTTHDTVEKGSRFDPDRVQGKSYRQRYWNDSMFDALDIVRDAAGKHGLTEIECALRWLTHHSMLKQEAGDAIIIGASSKEQLESNLVDLEKGPLPQDVVEALDTAWSKAKGVTYNYFH
jgi:aflatoxin B1 aldehyde reductase